MSERREKTWRSVNAGDTGTVMTITGGGSSMGSNFKMVTHYNSDNLHIKLTGNFDTLAAETLMKALHRHHKQFKKIFIYTNCLNSIETAGTQAFQHGYDLPFDGMNSIVFTGEHAGHIAPYAWQVM